MLLLHTVVFTEAPTTPRKPEPFLRNLLVKPCLRSFAEPSGGACSAAAWDYIQQLVCLDIDNRSAPPLLRPPPRSGPQELGLIDADGFYRSDLFLVGVQQRGAPADYFFVDRTPSHPGSLAAADTVRPFRSAISAARRPVREG